MSTTPLYTVFEYLSTLIAERGADEPFMLGQLQNALQYKFPDFSFAAYDLAGLKDFLLAGEKAGYFKLVNTGSMQTAYLVGGPKQPKPQPRTTQGGTVIVEGMGANDPRRTRWMSLAMEHMLTADRADQIIDAMQNVEALSPEYDAFLAAELKAAPLYPTRGKLKRIREFLATYRDKGEAQAAASWQPSRSVLRLPAIPPIEGAVQAQGQIWALLQGTATIKQVPVEQLDNLFFAVLNFSREQMQRNKSWDWVIALDMLEAEGRAVPRPVAAPVKKGLFGGKQQAAPGNELDESQIEALTEQLRQAAGAEKAQADDSPTWQAFVQTTGLDGSYRFLVGHPKLAEDERLMTWLEDQISQGVEQEDVDGVKNLANKAALVIGVRQFGMEGVRQQAAELKNIYESVMQGAELLNAMFTFLKAQDSAEAAQYFEQQELLRDESLNDLFDDQMVKAARNGEVERYRILAERSDLWRNLIEFGMEQGMSQHQRYLTAGQDEKQIQAEMGLLLLIETTTAEDRQDVIARYPAVVGQEGLDLATNTLDVLSFQHADNDLYNKYFEAKRLIERCIQLGVDRALAELK